MPLFDLTERLLEQLLKHLGTLPITHDLTESRTLSYGHTQI